MRRHSLRSLVQLTIPFVVLALPIALLLVPTQASNLDRLTKAQMGQIVGGDQGREVVWQEECSAYYAGESVYGCYQCYENWDYPQDNYSCVCCDEIYYNMYTRTMSHGMPGVEHGQTISCGQSHWSVCDLGECQEPFIPQGNCYDVNEMWNQ